MAIPADVCPFRVRQKFQERFPFIIAMVRRSSSGLYSRSLGVDVLKPAYSPRIRAILPIPSHILPYIAYINKCELRVNLSPVMAI